MAAERLGMERAMLEAVVANEVGRNEDISRYLKCTLLSATAEATEVRECGCCCSTPFGMSVPHLPFFTDCRASD